MLVDLSSHYTRRSTLPVYVIYSRIFRIDTPSNNEHVNTHERPIVIEDEEVDRDKRKI